MPKARELPSILTTGEAAEKLGISKRRVQQLVKSGRLPARMFGGSLMILEDDLSLVANRKTGRPRRTLSGEPPNTVVPKRPKSGSK
ncbi:MAG: helix-turn-helix domain-containing protein [Blastocatellia bacterium]